MSEKLLESEYFTIDLRSLFSKKDEEKSEETPANDTEEVGAKAGDDDGGGENTEKAPKAQKTKATKINWAKELEKRIAENEALDPETRVSEGAVENQFWKDYFADPQWDPDVARIASSIKLFKNDIKELGFDPKRNAILCFFLKNKKAINNLIKPGLIDSSKYIVLHNALSNPRLVADSEFMKANKYNIIYCPDFYTKPAKDMETYLTLQKNSLSPKASFYSEETQERNIRIFLKVGQKDVSKSTAKLNKLSDIEILLKKAGIEVDLSSSETGSTSTSNTSSNNKITRSSLIKNINRLNIVQSQAALQYLGMTSNDKDKKIYEVIQQGFRLQKTQADAIIEASSTIASIFKGATFSDSEALEIAERLLERIKSQI